MAPFPRARSFSSLGLAAALFVISQAHAAHADTTVQIPVDSVLDGRSVSTLNGQTIVTWSPGQGVDGDGSADGFVTTAVENVLLTQGKTENGKAGVALPDDGHFPATTRYPEIQLHFSNTAAATSPQTHQIHINQGAQTFQFAVPQATYSKLFVFITCSEGAAALTVTLNYAGGAAPTVLKLMLPDYGIGGAAANDPVFFNLISGMHKWSTTNQEGDSATHTITGIEINPTSTAMLTSVQVTKTNGSHAVFWGATGIATSAVDTGAGGTSGAGGSAGASAGGATGSAGATSAGGAGTSAGGTSAGGSTAVANGGDGGASTTTGGGGTTTTVGGSSAANTGGNNSSPESGSGTDSSSGCAIGRTRTTPRAFAWLTLVALCGLALRRRVRRAAR